VVGSASGEGDVWVVILTLQDRHRWEGCTELTVEPIERFTLGPQVNDRGGAGRWILEDTHAVQSALEGGCAPERLAHPSEDGRGIPGGGGRVRIRPGRSLGKVARRAVTLAQARTAETPEITTSDITTAITHLSTELANAVASSDDDSQSEFQPTVPTVTFDDIGGLNNAKQRLTELVTYPQQYDELYAQSSLTPANGVLLCGPPGTGKTLLAKALATETDRTVYAVDGAEIKSKWFGQSEQRLRRLFTTARDTAPSIIFFDEFDALAGTRHDATHSTVQSIVNTLLAELDGITETDDLLVIAATNYPDAIDPAVTRPGRLGETLDVPEPDDAAIREIFQIHTRDLPTADDVTPAWFAAIVPDGTTGAAIADLTEQALHYAIRDTDTESESPTITRHHLHHVINQGTGQNNEVDYGYQ